MLTSTTADLDAITSVVTGPALEPLDLDEVKKQLRFSSTSEDTLIDGWISAARREFERQTSRTLLSTTRELWLECFPRESIIELPYPPLISVTSVKYDDSDGVEQTMDTDDYVVVAPSSDDCPPGSISLASGASWPTSSGNQASVRIRYVAGYGTTPGDVPESIKTLLYWMVADFHKYRASIQEVDAGRSLVKVPIGMEPMLFDFRSKATIVKKLTKLVWA